MEVPQEYAAGASRTRRRMALREGRAVGARLALGSSSVGGGRWAVSGK